MHARHIECFFVAITKDISKIKVLRSISPITHRDLDANFACMWKREALFKNSQSAKYSLCSWKKTFTDAKAREFSAIKKQDIDARARHFNRGRTSCRTSADHNAIMLVWCWHRKFLRSPPKECCGKAAREEFFPHILENDSMQAMRHVQDERHLEHIFAKSATSQKHSRLQQELAYFELFLQIASQSMIRATFLRQRSMRCQQPTMCCCRPRHEQMLEPLDQIGSNRARRVVVLDFQPSQMEVGSKVHEPRAQCRRVPRKYQRGLR